ncbi:hypothetical protein GN956_G6213 [Arapaima gigas]
METGKQVFVGAPAPSSSVSAQREDMMHGAQTPLSAVYFHAPGGVPGYAHTQPPADQDTVAFSLSAPQLGSKPALSLLTLHIANGVPLQQPSQRLGVVTAAARQKSAGKHLCPYCGRDCLKPSVLEKHLRCHTGERPYPCTTCGVAFKTQSNLYKHKRTQAHARLSSDSERDSLSSQESIQGSRETSWSACSLEGHSEGLDNFEKDVVSPQTPPSTGSPRVPSTQGKTGPDTGWALQQAAFVGLIALAPHSCTSGNREPLNSLVQNNEQSSTMVLKQDKKEEGERSLPLIPNRHLPLQRQEATLFSRASRGKSQNHDSTDSGFSEGSEQHWTSSPASALHDHSMESLAESSTEEQEEPPVQTDLAETSSSSGNTKSRVSLLEKRKLEERISRLISENDALVDNKQLENVRPRKTMPSKQGSIDLPMPYTYKDSFHFEMKTSKQTTMVSDWHKSDRQMKQALYNSVPTQRSASLEHAPLARSSSLPFNIGNSGFERASLSGFYHSHSAHHIGRDNAGHYSGGLLMRSVDQPVSHHRSLVRQIAVDCLSSAESLSVSSSTEEGYPSSLGTDGESTNATIDSGAGGKCRRKKTQKFPYNKWYMYGDGTFRKLYNTEKNSERSTLKAKKPAINTEPVKGQETPIKNVVTFREPGSSGISTPDLKSNASVIDSAGSPPKLPPHLPPSGRTNTTQDPNILVASGTCLQKPGVRDLGVSTQQCVLKQSSLQMSDCKKDKGGNEANQEQTSLPLPLSQDRHHLPSERKKQRTNESMHMLTERMDTGKGHNVLARAFGHTEGNSMLSQNQLLSSIKGHASQMFTKGAEQSRSNRLAVERMEFNISSIDHHLNQKNVLVTEYPTPSKEVDNKQPASNLSFLPKYQLKLPQSTDLGRQASGFTAGTAERNSLSITAGTEEKQSSTPVSASLERCSSVLPTTSMPASSEAHATKSNSNSTDTYTATLIPTTTERLAGTPNTSTTPTNTPTREHLDILTSVSMNVPIATPTMTAKATVVSAETNTDTIVPTSSKSHCDTHLPAVSFISGDPPTTVTFSCITSTACFPEGESLVSSHLLPYKGKLTLLNGLTQVNAGDTGLFSEQKTDLQIFLQIVSGDQLSTVEAQQQSKQEASSSQDVSQEETKTVEGCSTPQKLQILSCHDILLAPSTAQKNINNEMIPRGSGMMLTPPMHSMSSNWRTGVEFLQTTQAEKNARPSLRSTGPLNPIAVPMLHCSKPTTQISSTEDIQNKVLPHCGAEGSNLSPSHTTERQSVIPSPAAASNSHQEPSLHKCHPDRTAQTRVKAEMKALAEVQTSVSAYQSPTPHLPHDLKSFCHQNHQQTFKGDDSNRSTENSCSYIAATGQQHQLTSLATGLQNPSDTVAVPPTDAGRFSKQEKHKIFPACDFRYPLQPQFSHQWNSVGCPVGKVTLNQPPHNESQSTEPTSTERTDKSRGPCGTDALLKSQIFPASDPAPCCTIHTTSAPHPAVVSLYHTRPWLCKEKNLLQKNQMQPLTQIRSVLSTMPDTDQSGPSCMEMSVLVKPDLQLNNHTSTIPLCATLEISQYATSMSESQLPETQNNTAAERRGTTGDVQEVLAEASSQGSTKAHKLGQHGVCLTILPGLQKVSLTGDHSFCPPSTGEVSSGSVLVPISSHQKPSHQTDSSSVGELKAECVNSVNKALDSSQMGSASSARGCEISTSSNIRQGKEVSLFPLLHATLSKSKLLPNSEPCTGISAGILQPGKPESMGVTQMTSDVLCQAIPKAWGSAPALAGARLLKRSPVMATGDGSQDQCTTPQGQQQGASSDRQAAGQAEVPSSCHTSTSFCTQGKWPNYGTTVSDVKDERGDPASGYLQGGSPSHSASQGEQGAQCHSECERSNRAKEGQDVQGVEGPKGDEKRQSDEPNGCKSHGDTSEIAASSVLQMPIQLKTTLMHTGRPATPSESPNPQSRQLPVQKKTTLRRPITEDPVLSGSALLGPFQEPVQSDTTGPQDTGGMSTRSSEQDGSVRSHTGSTHCIMLPGTTARGLNRTGKTLVRAGKNVPEDGVDSSSSDDEGKLVIELDVT